MIRSTPANATTAADTRKALALLKRRSTRAYRDGMAHFALPSERAFGISVPDIRAVARQLGRSHQLALSLWKTGYYEARMLATIVDEPAKVTPAQMDRWARDFDSWGICDAACFGLFDRTPFAFRKVAEWAPRKEEFVRRASFALLASLAVHQKNLGDSPFLKTLPLIERGSRDGRNFVKKGVSWALRSIGSRSRQLHQRCLALSRRLAASDVPSARWIGNDALRDLQRPLISKRVARREKRRARAKAL